LIFYIIYISLYFLRLAEQSQFIPPQIVLCYMTLPFLFLKIFAFS